MYILTFSGFDTGDQHMSCLYRYCWKNQNLKKKTVAVNQNQGFLYLIFWISVYAYLRCCNHYIKNFASIKGISCRVLVTKLFIPYKDLMLTWHPVTVYPNVVNNSKSYCSIISFLTLMLMLTCMNIKIIVI